MAANPKLIGALLSRKSANPNWNSLTSDQKIEGIPVMYLIDKNAISARSPRGTKWSS
jgi:hypothetical protein